MEPANNKKSPVAFPRSVNGKVRKYKSRLSCILSELMLLFFTRFFHKIIHSSAPHLWAFFNNILNKSSRMHTAMAKAWSTL